MATPIKRNKHIVALSKDHHFSLLFCWKLRAGVKANVAPERIGEYVNYFWHHHLKPHFAEEESVLFALLKDANVKRALVEHQQITKLVDDILNGPAPVPDQFSALANAVDNHVRYEERELFPHLEQMLKPDVLEWVENQLAAYHNPDAKDDFRDEFWVRQKNTTT